MVYPLPSLVSPFGQNDIIEEESYHGGQPPDIRNKSPLKLTVNVNVPGKSCVNVIVFFPSIPTERLT